MTTYKSQLPLHQCVELDAAYPPLSLVEGGVGNLFVVLENDENSLGKNNHGKDSINVSNNKTNGSVYSKVNREAVNNGDTTGDQNLSYSGGSESQNNFSFDPLVNSQIAGLSESSMREMLATYVARNKEANLNQGEYTRIQ